MSMDTSPRGPGGVVDARKATGFRTLKFESPAQVLAEIERLAEAERAGRLTRSGNWTAGQVFGHLATWIDFAYEGYPPTLRPPLLLKPVLRLGKKKLMRGPLPRGFRIPRTRDGTVGNEPCSLDEGLARVRAAWSRLAAVPPTQQNPVFGPLTHAEWITMHLRHAELHLGYLDAAG